MFRVENADFIADKLASELLPDQEQREVFKNAEEAIGRRLAADSAGGGRIVFDVDWALHDATGEWLLSCADDGDGMTRVELERYMTTLAVQGANRNQSIVGNQGMGLKIAGPTRHRRGVLIRSMKDDERSMVQVGWNGREYDLIPLGPNGEVIVSVDAEMFPGFARERGSGTVVTFLGNADGDNTFVPMGRPRGWLFKYMHQRFFRLSADEVDVFVRVATGEEVEWPGTPEEAAARQRKERGRSFNLSKVRGTATVWDDAADRQDEPSRGRVALPGDPGRDVPAAEMHWWVLPVGPGTDVSTRTASGGSIAALFQNELHDWRLSSQANSYFARLGVLFGKTPICFALEPLGSTIASDFARAHVLIGGVPVFESDAWLTWTEQFRAVMPERIKETMAEEQARLQHEDPDRARRIRDRLKDVMQLLRPRRFRRDEKGGLVASGPSVTGSGGGEGFVIERPAGPGKRRQTNTTRGIGAVLTQVDAPDGAQASEVFSLLSITPQWVAEKEAESLVIVNDDGEGLHDRAAALAGEDGATASILLLNRDFRGYQAILAAISEWANPDGDEDVALKIETFAQEWIEQKMVEAVNGLRQLENGSTWTAANFDDALSPVALTAAFMADRYHTLREVKRQVGPLRQAAPAHEPRPVPSVFCLAYGEPVRTASSETRTYTMTVSLNVLRHLGLNLYSSTPAVLSEAVANAWDADAKLVEITWDKTAKTITIADDGHGMDFDEINDKFLYVGYERRADGSTNTGSGRHVMGRKGIGKLSLFAIADRIDVHTVRVRDGQVTDRNALAMSTPKIKTAAQADKAYSPEPLDPDMTADMGRGTRIVLSKLNRSVTRATEGNLRARLARRFSIIGPRYSFTVKIDGKEVTPEDRDYFPKVQFLWSIGAAGSTYADQAKNASKRKKLDGTVDANKGWKVTGWVGTVDEVRGLDEGDNRIVLLAWGKLVQEDLLGDIKQGGLFTKYLVGELRADFLDRDDMDDIATSDRQRLKQTDPRYAALKDWVDEKVLKTVGSNWRDWRNEGAVDEALAIPAVKEWWSTLTSADDKKAAKKLFGKIGSVLKERESEKRELYAHTILAFEKLRARRALSAIDDLPDAADVSQYQRVFGGQDEVEMVLYHQIAAGRVAVLEKFAGIAAAEKEKVVQQYLYEHLWLMDPSWERPTVNKVIEQIVDKDWKKSGARLSAAEAKGRLDIRVVTTAGQQVIIELKRSPVKTPFAVLYGQMLKYHESLTKVLAAKLNAPNPPIRVIALVGSRPDDAARDIQDQALSAINGSIITYDELIDDAQESYRRYLDASTEASRLNEILARITEDLDEDEDEDAA